MIQRARQYLSAFADYKNDYPGRKLVGVFIAPSGTLSLEDLELE